MLNSFLTDSFFSFTKATNDKTAHWFKYTGQKFDGKSDFLSFVFGEVRTKLKL